MLAFIIGAVPLVGGDRPRWPRARLRSRLAAPRRRARWPAVRSPCPEDLPLAEAVRRAQEAQAGGIVTVTSGGRPVGVVSEAALLATPEERRPWVAGLDGGPHARRRASRCRPTSRARSWSWRSAGRPAAEYLLVEDDGSVYGVLATADVDRAFRAVAG